MDYETTLPLSIVSLIILMRLALDCMKLVAILSNRTSVLESGAMSPLERVSAETRGKVPACWGSYVPSSVQLGNQRVKRKKWLWKLLLWVREHILLVRLIIFGFQKRSSMSYTHCAHHVCCITLDGQDLPLLWQPHWYGPSTWLLLHQFLAWRHPSENVNS